MKYKLLAGYQQYHHKSLQLVLHSKTLSLKHYLSILGCKYVKSLLQTTYYGKLFLGDSGSTFLQSTVPHGIAVNNHFLICFVQNGILFLGLDSHLGHLRLTCQNIFIPNFLIDYVDFVSDNTLKIILSIHTHVGKLSIKLNQHTLGLHHSDTKLHEALLKYSYPHVYDDILHLDTTVNYAQSIQHISEYQESLNHNDAFNCYAMFINLNHKRQPVPSLLLLGDNDLSICELQVFNNLYYFRQVNFLIPFKCHHRLYLNHNQHLIIQTNNHLLRITLSPHHKDFNFRDSKRNNKIDNQSTNFGYQSKKHILEFLNKYQHHISNSKFRHLWVK